MIRTLSSPFLRYLAAKKSVDDRALNGTVWAALASRTREVGRVRMLEVGAGIGSMLERCAERDLFGAAADVAITAIDSGGEQIDELLRRVPLWAERLGFAVTARPRGIALARGELRIEIEPELVALDAFVARERGMRRWNLIVAQAVLDLLPVGPALRDLASLSETGALLYFPITYDGATIFQPPLDAGLDGRIEALYHASMDGRDAANPDASRTGRRLFHELSAAGLEVLEMGSSDWVVFPRGGGYRDGDADLIRFILDTVEAGVQGDPRVDAAQLRTWLAERRAQLERAELVYIAHQLDVLARVP